MQYHGECIDNMRATLKARGRDARCAIMLDTKGPEIRTGKLKDKTYLQKVQTDLFAHGLGIKKKPN